MSNGLIASIYRDLYLRRPLVERLDELERRGVLVRRRAPPRPLPATARSAGALKRFLAERTTGEHRLR